MTENVHWVDLAYTTVDLRERVNICEECIFKKTHTIDFAPFEIVGDNPKPDVLFVAESPAFSELKEQRSLIGKAGTLLRDVLETLQLNSYALANVVCCHPTQKSSGHIIRTPEKPEQEYCVPHVKAFIEQIEPKIIILLGRIAYENVLPEKYLDLCEQDAEYVGRMQKKSPYEENEITYGVSYHPSYILRSGGKTGRQYSNFVSRLRRILKTSIETVIAPTENDNLIISYHTVDDLLTILTLLEPIDTIGLDYEARDLDPWLEENKPIGFSFSYIVKEKVGRGFYICLDRELTDEERETLLSFFSRKNIWTYNAKYENNLTWAWLGRRVFFHDSFSLCKIDCSPLSLKENSRKYLGSDLWEEEVQTVVEHYTAIFSDIQKNEKAFPEIATMYKRGEYEHAVDAFAEDDKAAKKFKKAIAATDALIEVIGVDLFKEGLTKYPWAWEACPNEILGEYCCWDSYNTIKLKNKLWGDFGKYYKYYIGQTWLSGTMEAYGSCWNDEQAAEHDQYYFIEALDCLYQLIKLIDIDDEEQMAVDQIYHDPSSQDKKAQLEAMKKIFNPLSNKYETQLPFWNAFHTEFVDTCAYFHCIETYILQDESLDESTYIPFITKSDLTETISRLIEREKSLSSREMFYERRSLSKLLNILSEGLEAYYTRFAGEVVEFHYDALTKFGGVDIDDKATWTEEFTMLYLLRRFKKVMKSSSTYIAGKVGRSSVYLSRVTDLTSPPIRLKNYFDVPAGYTLKPNERWIFNTDFFENGADTKRWRAAIHTVPSMSELREIYTPRYPTSIILHADYSQAEVITMARLANETELLEAFKRGVDVHRFVASKIYKIPEEEVSKAQRKAAKSACVTGNTRIRLLDGRTLSVEDLSKEFAQNPEREYYTYSFDLLTRQQKPGRISFCGKTKKDRKIATVYLIDSSGKESTVTCTVDHLFLLHGEFYKKAEDLAPGDRLLHGRTWVKRGYEHIADPVFGGAKKTHHLIGEHSGLVPRQNEWVIHHKDFNKTNNAPNNLENMSWAEHNRFHSSCRDLGNFIHWSKERRLAQSQRLSAKSGSNWLGSVHYSGMLSKHLQYIRDLLHVSKFDKENYNKFRPHHTYCKFESLVTSFGYLPDELVSMAIENYSFSDKELRKTEVPTGEHLRSIVSNLWSSSEEPVFERRKTHSTLQKSTMNTVNRRHGVKVLQQRKKILNGIQKVLKVCSRDSLLRDYASCVKKCCFRTPSLASIKKYFGSLDDVIQYITDNFKVSRVEVVDSTEEVQFYDLTVDTWHNYAIEIESDGNTSDFIYTHNTFGILYGKGIETFARDLMKGDLEAAKQFFKDFFSAFPRVEKFIEARHREVLECGKVDTIFGDPIKILQGFGGVSAMKRRAQNYCIQSSASSMAAYAIYLLYELVFRRGLHAIPVGFTHDSVDWDIHISDLLQFIPLMYKTLVDHLTKTFGVPVKIDWEIGIHQNHMMELEQQEDSSYHFKCPKHTLPLIIEKLRTCFDVTCEEKEHGEEYAEMGELFMPRRAFSKYFGQHIPTVSGNLRLEKKATA